MTERERERKGLVNWCVHTERAITRGKRTLIFISDNGLGKSWTDYFLLFLVRCVMSRNSGLGEFDIIQILGFM